VTEWMTYQVEINSKLRHFRQSMDVLLGSLNGTATLKNCCFYENETMDKIIDNINTISRDHGNQIGAPIKQSGQLGKDLDNILPRMKELVGKGFKNCCEKSQELLKNLEEKLKKQMEDLKNQLSDTKAQSSKEKEELERKLKASEDQMKELKERLQSFEKLLGETGKENTKCCSDQWHKVKDLDNQLNAAKTQAEANLNSVKNQMNFFKDTQRDQEAQIKDLKKTAEGRVEHIKRVTEMCKQSCEAGEDKGSEKPGSLTDMESKVERLEKLINDLSENIKKMGIPSTNPNINITVNSCQENAKTLKIIEDLLQQMLKSKNETGCCDRTACSKGENITNRIQDLEKQLQETKSEVDKCRYCCKDIKNLHSTADTLLNEVTLANKTYLDASADTEKKYRALKGRLDEALLKLEELKKTEQGCINSNKEDFQMNRKAQGAVVDKVRESLRQFQSQFREGTNPFKKVSDAFDEKLKTMTDDLAKKQQESAEFQKQFDNRLTALEERNKNDGKANNSKNRRLIRLDDKQGDLPENSEKDQAEVKRLSELETAVNDGQEKLKNLEDMVNACRVKCKEIDKMDDLIDKIEDLEKQAKNT
ncbi:hypothetical protein KR018_006169, partial [Drosophila ironensis]